MQARSGSWIAGLLLRLMAGAAVGVLLVTVGYMLAKYLSRWAVVYGLARLDGEWLLPRFVAWAVASLLAAALLWLVFRRKSMLPAIVAAISVPVLYLWTFIAFFGVDHGMELARPYGFETAVVFIVLPGTIYLLRRGHRT